MTPDELKEWKNKFNCNQVQLAEMLGVSKMCVSRWERGERKIPPFLIHALKWLELKEGGESKTMGKKKRKGKS
jgi:predicted transcriptional regulator